jgi:hypothetical protein
MRVGIELSGKHVGKTLIGLSLDTLDSAEIRFRPFYFIDPETGLHSNECGVHIVLLREGMISTLSMPSAETLFIL